MDMDGTREKTQKLEVLMKNTEVDKKKALEILTRNRWNLNDSYHEIERMCATTGQRNYGYYKNELNHQKSVSPHHTAIDMGYGAVVNLEKKMASHTLNSPAYSYNPAHNNVLLNQKPMASHHHQQTTLPVRFPTTALTSRQETNIPIKMDGGRQQSLPQPYSDISVGNSLKASHATNLCSKKETNANETYNPPQSTIHESLLPSRESSIHPAEMCELPSDGNFEDDDVFDEKPTKKPPTVNTYPRLKRGFSNILENEGLVSEARHSVQIDIMKDNANMYTQTFVLPNLAKFSEDFRAFLGKELIETSTLVSLEQAGRLNWWAELRLCQRLLPMATSGDGNCLLHAASLAMWGIHDRQLILRKELHETLTKATYRKALYRRWRYQQKLLNKQSGLVFSEAEWEEEWQNILRLATPLPRGVPDVAGSNNTCDGISMQGRYEEPVVYESLEEFHVFVLAHVLRRPIIVVADAILKDSRGDALAPIPFPGIYLPYEVDSCYKSPLLLTYDAAHFSALSPMEQDASATPHLPAAIPLVDPELRLLPLHFYVDPGPRVDWTKEALMEPSLEDKINQLQKFLDVERIPLKLTDINGDSDRGSCGSQDSDESASVFKEKKKEEKKKDARMSQQVHTVAKQFGSIGKTMGKKLKQLGKVGRGDKGRQQSSVGNEITQSTRVMSSYGHQHNGQEVILVAKLRPVPGKQHDEMVTNYLQNAGERFHSDRELKRRNDVEIRSKVALYPPVNSTLCSTPDCNLFGNPQTNYLCSQCYATQHLEADLMRKKNNQFVYNTFPGRGKQTFSTPMNPDEIFRCGKSKFYTSSNEEIGQQMANPDVYPNFDKQTSFSNNNTNVPRLRSPSPDYDNVYDDSVTKQQMSTQDRQRCKTSECEFYGSPESDGFCSKCFKYKNSRDEGFEIYSQTSTKL